MPNARNFRIEGASPAQEDLLREVLAGLGDTAIEHVRLDPPERTRGIGLVLVRPEQPNLRATWDGQLLAQAFREVSKARGLPTIGWFQSGDGGWVVDETSEPSRRELDRGAIERDVTGAAAATGALLDRLDILDPYEPAPAVTLAVAEPHAFLRHGLGAYLALAGHDERYFGSFVSIVDGEAEPVWESGRYRYGGMSRRRADVVCCAPYSSGLTLDPGPPPCPVTARTWADAWAAFRRNLPAATGRRLDEWLELLAAEPLERAYDRFHWLRSEHGLGDAWASAIVDASERAPGSED